MEVNWLTTAHLDICFCTHETDAGHDPKSASQEGDSQELPTLNSNSLWAAIAVLLTKLVL